MKLKIKRSTAVNIMGGVSLAAITAAAVTLVKACTSDYPAGGVLVGMGLMAVWVASILYVGYLENKKP